MPTSTSARFPRVYAYVASLLRDRSAAEDVTAQAFERAYRKRASYRPARGTAEAWLFGIARNAALDELRRRKRHAPLEAEPEDRGLPDPRTRRARAAARGGARGARRRSTPASATWWRSSSPAGSPTRRSRACSGTSESNAGTRLHRTVTKLRKACDELA